MKSRKADELRRGGKRKALMVTGGLVALLGLALGTALTAPAKQERLPVSTAESREKTAVIPVEGMSCVSCVATIKQTLKGINGVRGVEVSLEHRNARVRFDEKQVSPAVLAAAIKNAGYAVGKPEVTRTP